jgi:cytochrome b involved in lipid metabolism
MTIKKELIIGIIITVLVLTSVFFKLRPGNRLEGNTAQESSAANNSTPGNTQSPTEQPSNASDPDDPVSDEPLREYTLEDIATHNVPEDCWVAISGNVYNLSGFNSVHPGGPAPIEFNCGKDGTQTFTTRGGKGPHPEKVMEVLNKYLIGILSE